MPTILPHSLFEMEQHPCSCRASATYATECTEGQSTANDQHVCVSSSSCTCAFIRFSCFLQRQAEEIPRQKEGAETGGARTFFPEYRRPSSRRVTHAESCYVVSGLAEDHHKQYRFQRPLNVLSHVLAVLCMHIQLMEESLTCRCSSRSAGRHSAIGPPGCRALLLCCSLLRRNGRCATAGSSTIISTSSCTHTRNKQC